ncbi:ATPase, T2SS/T4P/T4SS family, partial [Candidatus Oleimmundimicrobium sp.]|uniref:GspE/PulE family protein n=1 Tax=Candidatus Oleimmundimicrobium sp. TaxID=3060597 RepID=UPI002725BC46
MHKNTARGLGKILIEAGLITEGQLKEAIKSCHEGKSLNAALVDCGFVSEIDIAHALAKQMQLSSLDITNFQIDQNACSTTSEEMARRYMVLPIGFEDDKLIVAMSDPTNVFAIDDLRIVTGREIKPVVVAESDLLSAIKRYCKIDKVVEEYVESVVVEEEVGIKEGDVQDAPIIKLVQSVIIQSVNERASDIHIEPEEDDFRIRFRIDGVLHEIMRFPKRFQGAVLSRLKIMANMDIAEHRKPQDGRFSLSVQQNPVDFRVACLPTVYGEKIVLRLLRRESTVLELSDLGFSPEILKRFSSSFTKPYGAILVTGPTGSGKSTTLYATLNILNSVEKNIITVEDPVEYRLEGLSQIQINPKAGLTFASGLRSILRNDPDIIMVGEIRDKETALIAVESALTGHLVLSTLHTNDAPSAITRLTEMGIEPFLTASAVDCVLAQRLVRKLCPKCKEAYKPSPEIRKEFGISLEEDITFYRAKGCNKCNNTGYKGRIG